MLDEGEYHAAARAELLIAEPLRMMFLRAGLLAQFQFNTLALST